MARPEAGRFRAFVLHTAKNYFINEDHRNRAQKRGGALKFSSLDLDHAERRYAKSLMHANTPEKEFDRLWAHTVVERVLDRLKRDAEARGRLTLQVFTEPASLVRNAPVPNGWNVPGTPMRLGRTPGGNLEIDWDVTGCVADDYHLLVGNLEEVGQLVYADAICNLGDSGQTVVLEPGGSVFMLLVPADGSVEGIHGYRGGGQLRSASAAGFCGIATQLATTTCVP